ncbi:MAG TPA: amino acid racemase [Acidobacteriota bacterium]|nr:amino acid racemase [Acidobacteriota bacterium]
MGIIGGTGPESTIEYYRAIIAFYREQTNDGSYPSIIINSINLQQMVSLIEANRLVDLTNFLCDEIRKVVDAGADFAIVASNTPHIVFEQLAPKASIPLISIVEATCDEVARLGLSKVGLFGTRFTMQSDFYPKVFDRRGISLVTPTAGEQDYLHQKYMNELLKNVFLPQTERGLLTIVDRLKDEEGIEALVLAGTELPLILREKIYQGIPFLDTAEIHARRAVLELLS